MPLIHASIAAPAEPTTWDPANLGAGVVLDASRLVAQYGASEWNSARSTTAKTSGLWHSEVVWNAQSTSGTWQGMVGIGDSSVPLSENFAGRLTAAGCSVEPWDGTVDCVLIVNANATNIPISGNANNETWATEIDVDNHRVWWKNVTRSTGWTNAAAANFTGSPGVPGIGGLLFSPTGGVYIICAGNGSGHAMTFKNSDFSTPTSGFSLWT